MRPLTTPLLLAALLTDSTNLVTQPQSISKHRNLVTFGAEPEGIDLSVRANARHRAQPIISPNRDQLAAPGAV